VSPSRELRIGLVGEGAMGRVHAGILSNMPGVRLAALVAGDTAAGVAFAAEWHIPRCSSDLEELLQDDDIDALVIASPSGLHELQAVQAAEAGKPVLVEIPVALTLAGAERVADAQRRTGMPIMVAHTRRFAAPHRHLSARICAGDFRLQQLVVETYFMRRSNLNMLGQPRSWTDHLLWHHACHSVDLAAWLLQGEEFDVWATQGPLHPELGIAMDMSIGLRARGSGTLVTMALSFNHQGPFGGFYRYIGDKGTYRVFRDEIKDGDGGAIALGGPGLSAFESQDHAFIEAVRSGAQPACNSEAVLPTMRLLDRIERVLNEPRAASR
jgi:2-hydroxy-4-carboxymuconate semialdehyde hemiacetal dehydrogenase